MKKIITAIIPQEKNHQRVNIYLDGEFAFGLDVILAAWLFVGKAVDDEEINALLAEDLKTKAYHSALKYLQIRPRTKAELTHYLQGKSYSDKVVSETVEKCLQQQLIEEDEQFAAHYVEGRLQHKPMGKRRLSYELKRLGIAEEVIDQKYNELQPDEQELAKQVVQKVLNRYRGLDKQKFYFRLSQVLLQRGFSYEIVHSIVKEAWQELDKGSIL